jgi:hypothetical protein
MWTLWDGEYLYVAVSSRLNGRTPGNRILLKISGGKRSLDMVVTPEGVHCRGVYSTSLRLFGSFVASTGGLAAALGRDGRTAPLSGRYRLLSGARPA